MSAAMLLHLHVLLLGRPRAALPAAPRHAATVCIVAHSLGRLPLVGAYWGWV